MTVKILKSQADQLPDFGAQVAVHAAEMKDWRAHMARVKDDEAKGVTGINKHMPHPRPLAHPLVEAAVNENDDSDFEIVDDRPSAGDVLRQKKAVLFACLADAERAAIAAVAPPGKQRFLDMRENDIRQARVVRRPSTMKKIASAIGLASPAEEENPDDVALLNEQGERRWRVENIQRRAAEAEFSIEDLTADTIDSWQLPDFSDLTT